MWSWEVKGNSVKMFATKCSNSPNQVNSSMKFPIKFRVVHEIITKIVIDTMFFATIRKLIEFADNSKKRLASEHIVSNLSNTEIPGEIVGL
jgi:malic enzyme